MKYQETFKQFRRAAARYGLFIATWFFRRMPYSLVLSMSHFFVAIGYWFTIRQKKVARDSLRVAFRREKSDAEIEEIVRKCFYNLGQGVIELIYFMEHPSMIKDKVEIEGMDRLRRALDQGRGVIAVSAHFGNFPLMLLRLAREDIPVNAIIRSARDKVVEKYFLEKRSSLGLNTIYALPRRQCVSESIRRLRNNEFLFIPLDQNFGSGKGVFVEFFGQKAATATGPVVFARRTGAPIIPIFIIRLEGDRHRILIEEPMELEQHEDEKEMIFRNTAKITGLIESYIRRYPHEWGWMHRRWKTRAYEVKYMPNA